MNVPLTPMHFNQLVHRPTKPKQLCFCFSVRCCHQAELTMLVSPLEWSLQVHWRLPIIMCALFVCQAGVIVICLSSGIPVSAMYHLHCVSEPGVSVSAMYHLHCVYLSQVWQCLLCIPFTVCTSARCACVCCVSPALCVSQPGVPVSAVYHPHCVYLRQVYLCLLCITCTVHISARCVCVCCVSSEMCVSQPGVSVSTMCHLHCVYLSQVYLCLPCSTCTVCISARCICVCCVSPALYLSQVCLRLL